MLSINKWWKVAVFLLINIFYFGISFSQSLFIYKNGNDVTNNEIILEGNASDNALIAYLVIKNTANEAVQIKIRKIENSVIPGSQNSFCLGVCYAPFVNESTIPYSIAAEGSTKDSVFSVEYFPGGFTGKSVIQYEIFDVYNPDANKVSITVNFIISPGTGVDEKINAKEMLMVYPNPCNLDRITIRVNESCKIWDGKLIIMNSMGIVLNSFQNVDYSGIYSLGLSDYPNGIYYCLLINEEVRLCTEKVIIHR